MNLEKKIRAPGRNRPTKSRGRHCQTPCGRGKRITLRRLGELCNPDYANISRMESGKQNVLILTLKNIADILKIDITDLL
jgi:DNA-binding Xre family transcriptional regulator